MSPAELLLVTLLGLTQPGGDRVIGPALAGPWPAIAKQEAPTVDPRASASRYYDARDYLTVGCVLRFNPDARLHEVREELRLHIAAHEVGHCWDERPVPAGISAHLWHELYADVWAALAIRAAGRDSTAILRGRDTLQPYLVALLAALREAPLTPDPREITIAAYQIRERLLRTN